MGLGVRRFTFSISPRLAKTRLWSLLTSAHGHTTVFALFDDLKRLDVMMKLVLLSPALMFVRREDPGEGGCGFKRIQETLNPCRTCHQGKSNQPYQPLTNLDLHRFVSDGGLGKRRKGKNLK